MLRATLKTVNKVRAGAVRNIHTAARPLSSARIPSRWLATGGVLSTVIAGTTYFVFTTYLDSEKASIAGVALSSHASKPIPYSEVQKHTSKDSCWIIIEGQVYDVTSYLSKHPGGVKPILKNAGRDVTKVFAHIHRPGTLSMLDPKLCLGPVDPSTIPAKEKRVIGKERRV